MRESLWAFRRVFENGSLRRLQLAWAGSNVGAWAYTIAIAVYAFGEDGAYAVGLIGLARWVAAGVASPNSETPELIRWDQAAFSEAVEDPPPPH